MFTSLVTFALSMWLETFLASDFTLDSYYNFVFLSL